jgi:CRP-like cAMP-binding protein
MRRPFPPASDRAPTLRTIPFWKPGATTETTLTDRQREELARIGTRLRLPARTIIYREGAAAEWVFAIAEGALKSYRDLPSGRRTIGAFLFARDIFGLAENGHYLYTLEAITRVTLYRLPLGELKVLLKSDAEMQFKFLLKVTNELRESHMRALLMRRRDAPGRLATFLTMMEKKLGAPENEDFALPMTRSDIAAFLGLSLETVSRAAAALERRGLVEFPARHRVRILDPRKMERLAAAV